MYLSLLEALVKAVPGATGALLLDAEGEVVVDAGQAGDRDRHRLIGAYQGLALAGLLRVAGRYELGAVRYMVRRHDAGTVILRPQRDGYYMVLILSPDARIAQAVHESAHTQQRMNEEL